ncbi:MAG: ATP-binding protein [Candidatus Nanoarchaeia archaeon]|nr:ATP-binding protein [Candidatus Nanoarchaeia archaeon]
MASDFMNFVNLVRPLSKKESGYVSELKGYLDEKDINKIKNLLKNKKIGVSFSSTDVSKQIGEDTTYPQLNLGVEDNEVKTFVESKNKEIKGKAMRSAFRSFSEKARETIKKYVAPNIFGLELAKETAALQLFAKDPFHILLLGDPGTGKTDILKSVSELHPITSFGLGSGSSKAGLSATVKGDEIMKGLLPMANNGICCIDELNLMKKDDYAALYSAMEKGFITYDKANKHFNLEAKVRVIATSNPKGDRFVGNILDILKKQIPFDSALLTRFHLVFLIRKPSLEKFSKITSKIVQNDKARVNKKDVEFIKQYIDFSEEIEVDFPKEFEKEIVDFSTQLKKDEKKYLIEISPRLVIGLMRIAKASARMELRKTVKKEDIDKAEEIIKFGLQIKRE